MRIRTHGAVAAFLITCCGTPSLAAPGDTEAISVNTAGKAGSAWDHGISQDGRYVVFATDDPITRTDIPEFTSQVYVRDRTRDRAEMVSVGPTGQPANNWCDGSDISGDGRYVIMNCLATNLFNDHRPAGLLLRDRIAGANQHVAEAVVWESSISGNGRYVAYTTTDAMVAGDTNGTLDVYLWDRQTQVTERVSLGYSGQLSGTGRQVDISDDGRFVVFWSEAANVVPNDTNGVADVFVRDRLNKVTRRASVATGGAQANASSDDCAISGDGTIVGFTSKASNLVPGDGNGVADIFVRDLQAGATERVSVSSSGAPTHAASGAMALNRDGRYAAFVSRAANLVPGDTNLTYDVFVRDRVGGTTTRASVDSNGRQTALRISAYGAAISADGRTVGFFTSTDNWGTPFQSSFEVPSYVHELAGSTTVPVRLMPATTRFGTVPVGTSSDAKIVTVTNVSSSPVSITGVYLSGPSTNQFRRTSSCPASLAAGATCKVEVIFAPTSAGAKSAKLFVNIGADPIVKAFAWVQGTGG